MRKWSKILILMLAIVIMSGILVGCGRSKKAPEGMSQEFYNDSVKFIQVLEKTVKNATKDDVDGGISYIFFDKYSEVMGKYDDATLTVVEQSLLDDLSELSATVSIGVAMYFNEGEFFLSEEIAEIISRISDTLDIQIDVGI